MKIVIYVLAFAGLVASVHADLCADKPHGAYLPDPTSCQHYYHCTWGKAVRKDCGPGRVWDPRITNCNWDWAYKCVGTPAPSVVNSFCKKRANGYYAHPENCKMYITCSNGITYERQCPAGLNWNDAKKLCDWPKNAPCEEKSPTVTDLVGKISALISVDVTNHVIAAVTQIVEGYHIGGCLSSLPCSEASLIKRIKAATVPRDFVYARRLLGVMLRFSSGSGKRRRRSIDGVLSRTKTSLGDSHFAVLVGGRGSNSISFALDTTGSMGQEKMAMMTIVAGLSALLPGGTTKFILSPFNDPAYGPVTVYSTAAGLNAAVSALAITGGGDCPEKTFHGIVGALINPYIVTGSSLYVITDAPSKDYNGPPIYNLLIAKFLAQYLDISVTFFISASGSCSIPEAPQVHAPFTDIIASTGGSKFIFTLGLDISNITGVVFSGSRGMTRLSSGSSSRSIKRRDVEIFLERSKRSIHYTASFSVDPGLEKILVIAKSTNTSSLITLKTPSNAVVAGSALKDGYYWEVKNPAAGAWRLESATYFTYQAWASSKKNFAFVPVFLKKLCGKDVTLPNPLAGEEAKALITLSDESSVNLASMKIHVMSIAGAVISMATVTDRVARFTPPSEKFYLRMTISTTSGVEIVRLSKDLEAQSVVLVPKMTPSLFTVTPGVASPFNYILFNNAPSQTFTITAEAPLPSGTAVSPSPPSLTVPHNGNGEGVINITVPPGTAANTGVLLYVKAAGSGVTGDLVTTLVVNGGDVCSS
ncbi:von Willebrand factor A domain-containing protein 7 [Nematostella vectensis]|uniref:von Willebrand factor A domain-containing protein 7 n=1 Tax=Nematostella vectensis TaxID=45351 RepID=UPI0020776208|nr:von Willebrand factor A domain-containing protein 7 [Nematostella vectensis]